MADYYGLLARAVQALPRNEKSSRLEIYAKARHALIRQLKAIDPPLPPEEISKQRLSLEEAIRRVEREAAEAAAAAMLSEEEIGRQAEQALEEALSENSYEDAYAEPAEYPADPYPADPYESEPEEVGYEPPPPPQRRPPPQRPQGDVYRQPPQAERQYRTQPPPPPPRREEPQPQRVQFEPPPRQAEPEVMAPRSAYAETGRAERRDESYAEVVEPVRPQPAERQAPPPNWNRGGAVTDVEEPSGTEAKLQDRAARARRGGRGWERPNRHKREKMSVRSRLAIAAVLLIAVIGAGYYVWSDWDNVSTFVTDLFNGEPEEQIVVEQEIDPATGEPVVFTEPAAVFYQEPGADGVSARHNAIVEWMLVEDTGPSAIVAAHIEVPDRGLSFDVQIGESPNEDASHAVSVVTTLGRNADPVRGVDNVSVKTSEESIGIELEGEATATPDQFVLELPAQSGRVNTNRFATSPWFDIAFTYESGERAIVAFSKGTVGSALFNEAIATWAQ